MNLLGYSIKSIRSVIADRDTRKCKYIPIRAELMIDFLLLKKNFD